MATALASEPGARVYGSCHERDGKTKNKYSTRAGWYSPGPGDRGKPTAPLLIPCSAISMLLRCGCMLAKDLPNGWCGFSLWSSLWIAKWLASRQKNPLKLLKKRPFVPKPATSYNRLVGGREKWIPFSAVVRYLYQPASSKVEEKGPQIRSGLWKCTTSRKPSPSSINRFCISCTKAPNAALFARNFLSCLPTASCRPPHRISHSSRSYDSSSSIWYSIGSVWMPSSRIQRLS